MKTRPDKQQVNGMVVHVLVNGPTRVVVEVSGTEPESHVIRAIDAERAARDYGIRPDVVWVRNDGWSLGATFDHASAARRLWEGQWVALVNLTTSDVHFPE